MKFEEVIRDLYQKVEDIEWDLQSEPDALKEVKRKTTEVKAILQNLLQSACFPQQDSAMQDPANTYLREVTTLYAGSKGYGSYGIEPTTLPKVAELVEMCQKEYIAQRRGKPLTLNRRAIALLVVLINENKPISEIELANLAGYEWRTVLSSLCTVRSILKANNLHLMQNKDAGYIICDAHITSHFKCASELPAN